MNEPRGDVTARVERAVAALINATEALKPGDPVVVAVSGGADSLCLLHALHRLSGDLRLSLHVAHLNHLLRGADADGDAAFVAEQAAALGLPCIVASRDVASFAGDRGMSLEEAAREVRYAFLREVARGSGAAVVATGHTRDDAVETIVLHILRGSGVHGLRGLATVSPYPTGAEGAALRVVLRLLRPLLRASRAETMAYCHALGLEPRTDSSNQSPAHLRNRVRLEFLPLMRELNPGVDDALLRLGALATEDDEALDRIAEDVFERVARMSRETVALDVDGFLASPPAVQSRLVREAVARLCGNARDISFLHVDAVRSLAVGPSGKRIALPRGIEWRREYGWLTVQGCVEDATAVRVMPDEPVSLPVPGEVVVPGGRIVARVVSPTDYMMESARVAYVDRGCVGSGLWVRWRRKGDRFRPLGMACDKKVQDFMVDCHIPARERDRVALVCSAEHIVWLVGWRIDDRAKVTTATRQVARLEFVPDPCARDADV